MKKLIIILIFFFLVGCGEKKEVVEDHREYFEKKAEESNKEFKRKTDLILETIEKRYGPFKCSVCGHVKSMSAKACTNCGATW